MEVTQIILTFNDRLGRVVILHTNNDKKYIIGAEIDQIETVAKANYPGATIIDNTQLYSLLLGEKK